MGRHTGPVEKLSRREGIELYLKGERMLGKSGIERRGTAPPGQHGQRRQSRPSIYALQLREKQRAKRYYGVRERQFRRYVREATRQREERMGDELLARLERRLDNVVYRLGLASTRAQARQFVTHRHVLVDGRLVTIPSFLVDEGHVVALRTSSPVRAVARTATETVSDDPGMARGRLRHADRPHPAPPGARRRDRAGRRAAHRRVLLAAVTAGCAAEEVLLDIADRVARPAASMVSARARLALLAGRLPAPAGPAADLAAVARLLLERLPSPGPVLLPAALRSGRAHPLAAAAAGVAAAQRAGMAVDVVGNGDRVWLAHHDDGCTLVVDPGAPVGAFEGGLLGVDLHWRCAHELAALTLGVVAAARRARRGPRPRAARGPGADDAARVEHGEVAALRARMN